MAFRNVSFAMSCCSVTKKSSTFETPRFGDDRPERLTGDIGQQAKRFVPAWVLPGFPPLASNSSL
jgi:hypothetical protein